MLETTNLFKRAKEIQQRGKLGSGFHQVDFVKVAEEINKVISNRIENMTFSEALKCLKENQKIQRADWPSSVFIFLNEEGKICLFTNGKNEELHNFSKENVLAEDWRIY